VRILGTRKSQCWVPPTGRHCSHWKWHIVPSLTSTNLVM
jgi:hypothetical protein